MRLTKSIEDRWRDGEVEVTTWFERDRAHVAIMDIEAADDLVSWWDDDVRDMFDMGYFKRGSQFEQSVIERADGVRLAAYPRGTYYALAITEGDPFNLSPSLDELAEKLEKERIEKIFKSRKLKAGALLITDYDGQTYTIETYLSDHWGKKKRALNADEIATVNRLL